jgi:hypothetical protein
MLVAGTPMTPTPSDELVALRDRVVDRAPWPHQRHLCFDRFQSLDRGNDWGHRTALALYRYLRPEGALSEAPVTLECWTHGRAYNWKDDQGWLGPDGGGVLFAQECFGAMPGDGVDEVWHVAPDRDRCVIFDEGTDHTQYTLNALVSAQESDAHEALVAAVQRYFTTLGLKPIPPPFPLHPRRHWDR